MQTIAALLDCGYRVCSQGFIGVQLILTQNNYRMPDISLLLHCPYKMGKIYLDPEEISLFAFH